MKDLHQPTLEEMMTLVAELVPDIPRPSEIFVEIKGRDRILWLEGWCDGCIAGKGFPPKGQGMLDEKLNYIREMTPSLLQERAMERNMTVKWSGFFPLKDKRHLYGVSWAVFTEKPLHLAGMRQ